MGLSGQLKWGSGLGEEQTLMQKGSSSAPFLPVAASPTEKLNLFLSLSHPSFLLDILPTDSHGSLVLTTSFCGPKLRPDTLRCALPPHPHPKTCFPRPERPSRSP